MKISKKKKKLIGFINLWKLNHCCHVTMELPHAVINIFHVSINNEEGLVIVPKIFLSHWIFKFILTTQSWLRNKVVHAIIIDHDEYWTTVFVCTSCPTFLPTFLLYQLQTKENWCLKWLQNQIQKRNVISFSFKSVSVI